MALGKIEKKPKIYLSIKDGKVVVYSNDVKLDWAGELPPKKSVTIDGKVVTDDRDQMRVITSFVDSIQWGNTPKYNTQDGTIKRKK